MPHLSKAPLHDELPRKVVLTVEWKSLAAFIDLRAPHYWESARGIPREQIAACEQGCSLTLPRLYVDFLQAMGADTGDFCPFGVTQASSFYDLIEQLPATGYPGDKYFKVAFEDGESLVAYYDIFLDLSRSDGIDAPLVTFEDGGLFRQQSVHEFGFTLGEQLTRRVFGFFEVERRPATKAVDLFFESDDAVEPRIRAALELLAKMGLEHVFSRLPRVACLRSDDLSALVARSKATRGFGIELGATDSRSLRVAVEQICDRFPEAVSDD